MAVFLHIPTQARVFTVLTISRQPTTVIQYATFQKILTKDKGLISKIYKQLMVFNVKKKKKNKQPNQKKKKMDGRPK